jgi:hypothetical protein
VVGCSFVILGRSSTWSDSMVKEHERHALVLYVSRCLGALTPK